MAGSVNAGSIIYEVDMDTARLLAARREVDAALSGMNGTVGRLDATVTRAERSVASMQRTMSSLSAVARGVIAAISVQQVAAYGNEWVTVNNKLANSVRANESLAEVTQRVFDISQNTMSSLAATATLYGRLERATRSAGTSTKDLVTLTSTINKGLAVSGATTEEASSTMTQLSQALASGVLRGEEFNSISENGSRLAVALADSLGVTIGQLRGMAAEGKLTTEVVVNGLLKQSDAIAKEFANTVTTMGQAFTIATNNITKFIGESSTVQSSINVFNSGIISLSQNLETISTVLIAVSTVMGGRFAGALAMATSAKIKDTAASISSTKAAAAAAKNAELEAGAKLRLANVEKAAAIEELKKAEGRLKTLKATNASVASEVRLAEAEALSIRTSIGLIESEKALEAQRLKAQITEQGRIATATRMAQLQQASTALNNRLAAAEAATSQARANVITRAEAQVSSARLVTADATGVASAANGIYTASQEATVVANRAASASLAVLRTGFGLIGGPAGIVMIAAAALFYWWHQAKQAKEEAIAFADGLDNLNASMKSMSNAQLRGSIADANESIRAQKEVVSDLESEVSSLQNQYQSFTPEAKKLADSMGQGAEFAGRQAVVADQLAKKTRDLQNAKEKLGRTEDTASSAIRALNSNMLASMGIHEQLAEKGTTLERVQGAVARAFGTTADEVNRANQAQKNYNPKSMKVAPPTERADESISDLQQQNELLKIQDERLRAVTKAGMDQAKVTNNPNQIAAAKRLAGENFDLQQAEKARSSTSKETAKAESQAEQAEKRRQKSLKELTDQAAVAELQFKGLNREAAQLSAIQDLGAGATAQQIEQASQQAGQIFDIQQRAADKKAALEQDALANASRQRDLDLAQVQRQLAAGDISFEQSQKRRADIAASYSEQIAQANAKSAVTPQQAAAATVDPVQALANENAQKLALIQQFEASKTITEQQGLALRNSLNTQYEQQRNAAMWTMWRNQSAGNEAVAASFDSLAGNASNAFTGMVTGSMTAQEAMSSLANNAINSLINSFVQMGVEWIKSAVMGSAAQTTAVATTTAASVAGTATTTAASTTAAGVTLAAWTPAALVASIGSFGGAAAVGLAALLGVMALSGSIAGKRKNGGPVSAGSMYQVGEGGMPEIFRASNGSQYMIPGDNGSVISNKDLSSGGGSSSGGVVINIQNYTSATVDAQAQPDGNGGWTVTAFIADMNQGGPASRAITENLQTQRRARE